MDMQSKDLWQMFKRTGDIEWYTLYCSMREQEKAERKT